MWPFGIYKISEDKSRSCSSVVSLICWTTVSASWRHHSFFKIGVNSKKKKKKIAAHPASVQSMKGAGGGECLKGYGNSKQRYRGIVKKTVVGSCTYYANILHLSCNHNRQGPSGSHDTCQPLIINVSSEKSRPGCSATLLALIFQPDTRTNIYFHITGV